MVALAAVGVLGLSGCAEMSALVDTYVPAPVESVVPSPTSSPSPLPRYGPTPGDPVAPAEHPEGVPGQVPVSVFVPPFEGLEVGATPVLSDAGGVLLLDVRGPSERLVELVREGSQGPGWGPVKVTQYAGGVTGVDGVFYRDSRGPFKVSYLVGADDGGSVRVQVGWSFYGQLTT